MGDPTYVRVYSVSLQAPAAAETDTAMPITPDQTQRTTAGVEIDYARELRFSHGYKDGMRYVEVMDGNGNYITSTMGTAADAIYDLMLYLLPADHPDYPRD